MKRRILSTLVVGCLPLVLAAWAWSSQKAVGDFKEEEVYQFGEAQERETIYLSAGGGGMSVREHNYLVTVRTVYGGEVQKVVLMAPKTNPLAQTLTGMKSGEYLTLTLQKQNNNTYIRMLAAYSPRPGEDLPGVFVFSEAATQKAERGAETTVLKLYKLGRFITVALPNVREANSVKMIPEPNLALAVGKLSRGNTVEVAVAGGGAVPTVKSIERYAAPQDGVFAKAAEAEVEGGKTPAAEVTVAGAAKTLLVPGRKDAKGAWVPDGALAAAIKRFKEGDKVTVRFREEDGKCWLKEIKK